MSKIFFLTIIFTLLFFGGKVLAAECVSSPGVSAQDCTVSITYQDPGGAGLAVCSYKAVLQNLSPGTDYANWPSAGTCSGSGPVTLVTSPNFFYIGTNEYGIYWYAKDNAGNSNNGFLRTVNVNVVPTNSYPSVTSISDAPDPIYPGSNVTFSLDWSDPDSGEQVKIHLCKTNAISGQSQSCSGGSWCDSSAFTISDPAGCSYFALGTDIGINNYYAFVCDDSNACSLASSGSFEVSWCLPPVSGDWSIPVVSCILTSKNYTVNGNLIIRNGGVLDLRGTTNIVFSGSPRYIYIYPGGNFYIANTAGFNK